MSGPRWLWGYRGHLFAPVRLILLDLIDTVTPQWLGRGRVAVTVAWSELGEMLEAL